MKIGSASVYMSSSSVKSTVSKTSEKWKAWAGNQPNTQNSTGKSDTITSYREMMERIKKALEKDSPAVTNISNGEEEELFLTDEEESKILLLNKLIEALTGKKIKFNIPKKMVLKQNNAPVINTQPLQFQPLPFQQGPVLKGWGLDYQRSDFYSESESMNFNAGGTVLTSDGKEINFELQLNLSRSFVSQSNISIKAGDALIDPLVINFDRPSATLTDSKYSFDLDLDGKNDQISFTQTGSGFLVYDKNGDGKINDGSELFGPKIGNGFLELEEYDSDGNNWIDENDPIYDKLQIWTKDENGTDQLFAIGKKGIGAIYLGSVNSSFSLKDESNNSLGQIQQTGIFLREDGSAGTVQHIDISL